MKKPNSSTKDKYSSFSISYLDSTTSTNDEIKSLFLTDAPSFTVVTADHQTQGRGRNGVWKDSSSAMLLFSVLLRPFWPLSAAFYLYKLALLSLLDMLSYFLSPSQIGYKYPNDIYLYPETTPPLKVGGILIENDIRNSLISGTCIGVGVNIRSPQDNYWEKEGLLAIAIEDISKKTISKEIYLLRFLKNLEKNYRMTLPFYPYHITKQLVLYQKVQEKILKNDLRSR